MADAARRTAKWRCASPGDFHGVPPAEITAGDMVRALKAHGPPDARCLVITAAQIPNNPLTLNTIQS